MWYNEDGDKMSSAEIIRILIMVLTTFLFVTFIMPIIKNIAVHIGALDIPNARKVHQNPIPRLGGLGIYLGFLLGYMIFGEPSSIMNSILIGSFIIVITGMVKIKNKIFIKFENLKFFVLFLTYRFPFFIKS